MEFLFPHVFVPRLDAQTDQNVSVRLKPAVLWPDEIVGLYRATKQSVGSDFGEDCRDSLGNEMNPAQHPL